MANKINKKGRTLLAAGMIFSATAQVLQRYTSVPDFFYGIVMGVGLGLMLLVLISSKFRVS